MVNDIIWLETCTVNAFLFLSFFVSTITMTFLSRTFHGCQRCPGQNACGHADSVAWSSPLCWTHNAWVEHPSRIQISQLSFFSAQELCPDRIWKILIHFAWISRWSTVQREWYFKSETETGSSKPRHMTVVSLPHIWTECKLLWKVPGSLCLSFLYLHYKLKPICGGLKLPHPIPPTNLQKVPSR